MIGFLREILKAAKTNTKELDRIETGNVARLKQVGRDCEAQLMEMAARQPTQKMREYDDTKDH